MSRAFKGAGEALSKFKSIASAAGLDSNNLALKIADVGSAAAELSQVMKPGPAAALAAAITAVTYAYGEYIEATRRGARIVYEGLSAERLGKIRAEFPKLKDEAVVSLASVASKAGLTTRDMVQLGIEAQKAARASGKSFSEELQPALERVANSVDAIRAKAAAAREALVQAASGSGNILLDQKESKALNDEYQKYSTLIGEVSAKIKELNAIRRTSGNQVEIATKTNKLEQELNRLLDLRYENTKKANTAQFEEDRLQGIRAELDLTSKLAEAEESNYKAREQIIRRRNAALATAIASGLGNTVGGLKLQAQAHERYNREILALENQLGEALYSAQQGQRDAELESMRQAGQVREAERLAIARAGSAAIRQALASNEENAGARAVAIQRGVDAQLANLGVKFAQEDRQRAAEQNRVLLDLALDYAQKRQAALVQAAEGGTRADAEALVSARTASAESLRLALIARDQKALSEEQYAADVIRIQRDLALAEGKIRAESATRAADARRAAREQARSDALGAAGRQGIGDNALTGALGDLGVKQQQIEDLKLNFADMGTAGVAAWSAIGAASETAGGIIAEVQSALSASIKQSLTDTGYASEMRLQQAYNDEVAADKTIQNIDKQLKATEDATKRQVLMAQRKARVDKLAGDASSRAAKDESIEKKRATKEIIAGIAAQAAVKAIFTGAEAVVAAAFGSPTAVPLAAAAAAYASIAGVAAGVSSAMGGGRTSGEKKSLADLRKQRETGAEFGGGAGDSAARAERRAEALSRRGQGGRTVVNITFAGAPLIPSAALGEYINTARAAAQRLQ
jgi:hypothetical protein